MKLLQFKQGNKIRLGIKTPNGVVDVAQHIPLILTMEKLLISGESGLKQLTQRDWSNATAIPEEQIVYAPCITSPEKIICIGLNYKGHAKELGAEFPEYPVIFSKFNNALAAHNEKIPLPKIAEKYDYEAELVIIMGREAKNVPKEDALSYVLGYTVGNDLSARDLQFRSGQWLIGKTLDKFAPIGPHLVTADEVNPDCLDIQCAVNGEVCQASNTSDQIFDCSAIISYLSQIITLKPGDIIFTGTPPGVIQGKPTEAQKWLSAGDEVVISIENIGSLKNVMA